MRFAIRPVSLAAGLLLAAPASFGLPQGATPTFGQTTVKQTAPNQLDIRQTSPRAGIDWTRFSIAAGEKVIISQPGSTSVLLNRVLGNDPSLIYGQMQSNGSVWLINPRGIVFGAGSRVDVGSLVASTLSITSEDVASGRLLLGRGAGEPGELRSEGTINAPGGTVALIAPRITHTGSIAARRVGLAAASEVLVDVEGDGLIFFNARNDGLDTRLSLLGNVLAGGGSVEARAVARAGFADTVLNLEGIVQARSLGERNGRIVIDGGPAGITRVAGTLDASGPGAGQHGGDVVVLGEKVLIDRGALLDASGHAGGGQVRVGGDYQGRNPDLPNASMVTVMPEALLSANASSQGDGGRIIVWSDDATRFHGGVQARGGPLGGHGGFAEVSGKAYLDFQGTADLSAPLGSAGTLLLDPTNLTIASSGASGPAVTDAGLLAFGSVGAADSVVTAQRIVDLLTGTGSVTTAVNVDLQALNNITVNAAITAGSGTQNLSLRAGNNISVSTGATISIGGSLSLSASDSGGTTVGSGAVTVGANLSAGSTGSVTITNNGGTGTHAINATISAATLNLTGNTNLGATGSLAGPTVDLAAGSTLSLPTGAGNDKALGGLSGAGTVALANSNSLSVGANNASTTFSGTIQGGNGSSSFLKQGSGTLTLTGSNTYSGPTNVSAGTLEVNGALSSTTIAVNAGTLSTDATDRLSNNAAITLLAGATLALGGDDTIGSLAGTGGSVTLGANTLTTGGLDSSTTFAGVISGSGGGLTKAGTGTFTLSGINTYTGTTTVANGTLAVNANLSSTIITVDGGSLSTNAANRLSNSAAVTVNTGATLALGGSDTIGSLAGSGGSITLAGTSTLSTGGLDTSTTFAGVISGTGDSLTKTGTGTLTLTGTNTYTGTTTVSDGTLAINANLSSLIVTVSGGTLSTNAANRLSNSSVITVNTGGTLALGGNDTIGSLAGSGGSVTLGGATLSTGGLNSSTSYAGIISGSGGDLTKNGTGTFTLTGNNSYTGTTTVANGTLALQGTSASTVVTLNAGTLSTDAANRLADAAVVTVNTGATLALGGSDTIGSLAGSGGSITLGAATLTTGGLDTSTSYAGVISGSGGLTKTGTGTFTLTGANSYTGTTTVSDGTLAVENTLASTTLAIDAGTLSTDAANRLANTAVVTVNTGATLALGGDETIGSLAGSGGSVTLGNDTLTTGGLDTSTSFAGIISGNGGSLVKTGTGTFTLTGANSYSGGTTVSAGTLAISGGIAAAGTNTIALTTTGAVLDLIDGAVVDNAVTSAGGTVANSSGAGTLQTGGLTLSAASTLNSAGSGLAISADIGGNFTIAKTGGSSVTLSGANTYGNTTVSAGTLALQSDLASTTITVNAGVLSTDAADRIANNAVLTVNTGATLALGGSETIGSLAGSGGSVTLGAATLTTGGLNSSTSYAGVISGSGGGLVKAGSGSFTLTGANTYTGSTTVSAGTLAVNGNLASTAIDVNAGTLSTNAANRLSNGAVVTVATGATLALGGSDTIGSLAGTGGSVTLGAATLTTGGLDTSTTFAGVISGSGGGLTKAGTGTFTLTGANSYTGTTTVNDGALAVNANLSSTTIAVNAGTLSTNAANRLANSAAITVAGGATLALGGSDTIGSLAGAGSVTLGSATLTTGGLNTSTTFSGEISGSGGSLSKAGTGSFTLAGINSYTGDTNVDAGTLVISGAGVAGGGTINIASTGTLDLIGGAVVDNAVISAGGTLANSSGSGTLQTGGLTLTAASTLGSSGGGLTVSADIAGGFAITKTGAGTVTLSGNNSFGDTTVSAGTLAVNGNLASTTITLNAGLLSTDAADRLADSAAVSLAAGATLALGGSDTIGSLAGSGGSITLGANTLSTGGLNTNTSYAGVIGGSGGSLTKQGSGTFTLTGANTYTGATTVSAGTLAVNAALASTVITVDTGTLSTDAANRLANSAAVSVNSGATLALGGSDTIGSLAGSGGSVTLGAATLTTGGLNTSTSYAGVISGSAGNLVKNGTGSFTLAGANSYTGTTTVNAGTLAVNDTLASTTLAVNAGTLSTDAANRLANSAVVSVGAGATLALGGNDTIGSLAGAGDVALGTATLTTGGLNTSTTFAGAISGSGGSLVKTGTGTFTLTGISSHDGGTAVNGGTLAISGGGVAGTGTIGVAGTATLDVIGGATVLNAIVLSGGTLGNSSGSGSVATGGVTLSADSALSSSGSGLNIAADIGGAFNLTKAGAGTVTLGGNNTHVDTTVSAGTLAISGAGTAGSGTLAVAAGTVLDLIDGAAVSNAVSLAGGTIANSSGTGTLSTGGLTLTANATVSSSAGGLTISADIAGNAALTKAGAATVTLSGNNSYTGSTSVNAGTLALGSATAVPATSALTLANASGVLLDVLTDTSIGSLAGGGSSGGDVALGANQLTAGADNTSTSYAGTISGSGGRLEKAGSGSLTLTGASSHDGGTAVSAGTLVLSGSGVAGTGTITVASGATLDIVGGAVVNNAVSIGGGTLANSAAAGTLAGGGLVLTADSTFDVTGSGLTISADLSGTGGYTKTGSGALTLSGNNNGHSGASALNAGALIASGGNALGDTSALTLANVAGVSLTLQADETVGSLAGGGALGGNVVLGANTLTTGGDSTSSSYAGVLSGSGGLTKAGSGNFSLSAANTYTGTTRISAGTLTLQGGSTLADNGAVVLDDVAGATLALAADETIGSLAGGGAAGGDVALGSNRLTTGGNNASTTFSGILSGNGGALTKTGSGSFTLAGNNTYTGGTLLSAGTLIVQGTLASPTLDVDAGSFSTASADRLADNAVLTVADGASATIGGDDSILRLVLAGTLNGVGSATLTATDTTLAAYTLNGGTANANLGAGRLVSTGSSAINGSSGSLDVNVSSGTLSLGAGSNLADTAAVTVSFSAGPGTTLTLGTDDTIGSLTLAGTLNGSGTLTATSYTLAGANIIANLGLGTLTSTGTTTLTGTVDAASVTVASGQLVIAVAERLSNAATVTVATGADLRLNANETIDTLALSGTTSGSGVLTAINFALNNATFNGDLGTGDLVSNGISQLNGSSATGSLLVESGTLTLAGGGSMTAAPDVTVDSDAALVLLRNERFGSLTGAGSVQLGRSTPSEILATLRTGSGASSSYAGVISGPGSLIKEGSSTFTLSGANSYAGSTTVAAGTLALDGANRLGNTAVTVNGGATLSLDGNDTVSTLTLRGTLAGSGTLTAATYTLAGGNTTVNADLGAGTLNSTLASVLAGNSAAGTVNVDADTLTLASGGRFTAAPALVIDAGATLALGGNETAGLLSGAGNVALGSHTLSTGSGGASTFAGAIGGSGNLVKQGSSSFTLSGANGYTGSTTVTAGTLAVSGTLASTTIDVDGGTLALGAANRLANTAVVNVADGASMTLSGADTIGTLNLGGTLGGNGTLTAASYNLAGGNTTVNAGLGAGTLNSTLASVLAGPSAAGTVNVDADTLTLAGGGRFTAAPAVVVDAGATLALGGNETTGTLAGAGNVALGSNTLSTGAGGASAFAGVLAGSGSLVKQGSSTFTLSGANSYTGSTTVAAGTLALDGANRLGNTAVTVNGGATLSLDGNDTVSTLTLRGTLAGSGTLTAATYTLAGGNTTVNADLGAGTLNSTLASVLAGNSAAGTVNVDADTLTLASGGRFTAAPALVIDAGATLALGGNETAGLLSGAGNVALGSHTLSTGSGGASTFAGAIGGSGNLVKQGSSSFTLSGANGYTGSTTVAAGTLAVSGTLASTTIDVDGGTLALGAANRLANTAVVNVADGASMTLSGADTIGTLNLGGTLGGNGALTAASYNLAGGNTTVNAGLGAGTLNSTLASVLAGPSAAGTVNVDADTLTLAGGGRFTAAPAVVVDAGATLALGGNETTGTLAGAGNVALGSHTLSTGAGGAATFAGVLAGSGSLVKQGSGTFTLSGANSYTGSTTVAAGTLALDGTLVSTTINVNAGSLRLGAADRLAGDTDVTLAGAGTLVLGGDQTLGTLAGAGNVALGSHTLFTGAGGSSTFAGVFSGTGNLVKQGSSTFTLTGASTHTGSTTVAAGRLDVDGTLASATVEVDAGTLALGAADRLANGAVVSVASGATMSMNGSDTIGALNLRGTLAGNGTLSAGTYTLSGATVNADLGSGTVNSTGDTLLAGVAGANAVNVDAGTLTLAAANRLTNSAVLTVADGASLAMTGNDVVGSLRLAGTLSGSGTLTAASYSLDGGQVDGVNLGAGTLNSTGESRLDGNSAASVANITGGRLTLANGASFSALPAMTVDTGATLALGGNEAFGSLAGAGSVALGAATLRTGSGASSRFDGVISGSGGLVKQGASTFTLGGANTYAGNTEVAAGTLALAAANRLANGAEVSVASGATLAINGNDTIGGLTLAGTLSGNGTLTAASYALASAVVDANLGAGSLVSTGNSTLNGSSGASTVDVASGTLTMGSGNRLAGNAALSVADGASLVLAGSDTIGSLALAGTLSGTGTLTAATYALDGAVVDARLGRGALSSTGASLLSGTSAADSVAIDAGSMTLASGGRFSAAPVTTVASGATLALGGNETLGSLAGSGSVALGAATLSTGSAGSTTFAGVLAGSGKLAKQGDSTFTLSGDNTYTGSTTLTGGTLAVDGTLASRAVAVNGGRLLLGAADRLADNAALSVADTATLTMNGNDSVASLVLAGTLDGSGTLTAATYALAGGNASADLGAGRLTSTGNSQLSGTSAAGTVSVDSGRLTLAGADRLNDGAAVSVAEGATLRLNGNDTVGSLVLAGTLDGSGIFSAATYALAGGTAAADLGSGALTSTGNSTLSGVSAADSVRIASGRLTLLSPDRGIGGRFSAAPAVNVASNSLLALGGNETFGTLAGGGTVDLGPATLATGSTGPSTFAGVITGIGALVKQGNSTFTLTGASDYSGTTTVEAGTLSVGGGGSTGSLATSAYVVEGVLRFDRDNAVRLDTAVSGGGAVDQAGSGTLTLAGRNKSHSGATTVSGNGELATEAAGDLSAASAVRVDANGRLTLAGAETVAAIDAVGAVSLGGNLTSPGDIRLAGPARVSADRAIALRGANIDAQNLGNDWGSRLSLLSPGAVRVSSGGAAGALNDLVLGDVEVGNGGRIDAGRLTLDGNVDVLGGNLQLVSTAARTITEPTGDLLGKLASGLQVALAADVVSQAATSTIAVAEGASLAVVVPSGGSVSLDSASNRFGGVLSVRSGAENAPWALNPTRSDIAGGAPINYALQGRVRVNGTTVNIGPAVIDLGNGPEGLAGIEADVVSVRADRLATTPAGAAPRGTIVARLPFDNTVGTENSLPGLTLELSPAAFELSQPFGQAGNEININVGNRAFGNRALALDSGYLQVLPRGGARGSTAVILSGPSANTGYQFFFDGAGQQGEIPVFYNGVLPVTPQVSGTISAIVSVSESARRERFEEAVRTENVAVRLRAGVIAEVGPGRPATQGSEGAKPPPTCPPVAGSLSCTPAP